MDVDAARLFNVLDDVRKDIKGLCERITKLETQYKGHIEELKTSSKNKERTLYGIIGLMTVAFTAYELFFS